MGETAEIFGREASLNFDLTRPPRNIFFSLNLWFYSAWKIVGGRRIFACRPAVRLIWSEVLFIFCNKIKYKK